MSLVPERIQLAIAAVVMIASNDGAPVTQREVSRLLSVPERHFEASLQVLSRAGILKSFRGAHGGYVLGDAPHLVSCAAIAKALFESRESPPRDSVPYIDLVVDAVLAQADADFFAGLQQITVATLISSAVVGGIR